MKPMMEEAQSSKQPGWSCNYEAGILGFQPGLFGLLVKALLLSRRTALTGQLRIRKLRFRAGRLRSSKAPP